MSELAGDTVSWAELFEQAKRRLDASGVESPGVAARRIVEHAAGIEPARFAIELGEAATVKGVARLDSMVDRHVAGEPLQYVIGSWGFRGLDLMVDRRVLIPRPETEVVAGLAIAEAAARSGDGDDVVAVDLGTGSGAIALAIAAECPEVTVMATDASADALAVARANLAGIGRAATRVSIHEGSWFEALPDEVRGRVDLLVSNPPYVADSEELPAVVSQWEPVVALRAGPRGTEAIEHLFDEARQWLGAGGVVVVEMAPSQTEAMAGRATRHGFVASVHPDMAGRARAVVARMASR